MRRLIVFLIVFLAIVLGVLALPDPATADYHPGASIPAETVRVRVKDRDYVFTYRKYAQPLTLNLSKATGKRDTPFRMLNTYFRVFRDSEKYEDMQSYGRMHNGEPGPEPPDKAAYVKTARKILSGRILIYGEIEYGAYTIYIHRYENSALKRFSGLPMIKADGIYVVIKDLVNVDDLARRLSALRWDVARIKKLHPAGEAR